MRDVRSFAAFIGEMEIDKQKVLDYKERLGESYAVASANSMIAATNCFLRFCGWHDLCVKQFKMQRQVYCSEDKELTRAEYVRLLAAASAKHNQRLHHQLQKQLGYLAAEPTAPFSFTITTSEANTVVEIMPYWGIPADPEIDPGNGIEIKKAQAETENADASE